MSTCFFNFFGILERLTGLEFCLTVPLFPPIDAWWAGQVNSGQWIQVEFPEWTSKFYKTLLISSV